MLKGQEYQIDSPSNCKDLNITTQEYLDFSLATVFSKNDTIYNKSYSINMVAILTMIYEYEMYERECYNDSILHERVHYIPEGSCICHYTLMLPIEINYCKIDSHYKDFWIREQPTFEGFIIWLKEKYKY
jgi:hypothetical protein